MNSQKGGFATILVLLVIVLVGGVGVGWYLSRQGIVPKFSGPATTEQPPALPEISGEDETANWETYESPPEFGYSFKYPANFWITSVQTTKPGVATIGDAPPAPENTVASLSIRQNTIDEKFNLDARTADYLRIYSEYKVLGQKNIQVATYPARYVEATVNNNYPIILVLVQKDNSYAVLLEANTSGNKITSSRLKSIFDQILSTFKFLD